MPGAVDELVDMLEWCGIKHDEGPRRSSGDCGPYVQSERLALYREHAERLVEHKCAYRCFCSVDRLEKLRSAAYKRGSPVMYDRKCLSLSESDVAARVRANEAHTIRLSVRRSARAKNGSTQLGLVSQVPMDAESTTVIDRLRGPVRFRNDEVGDQILLKADGFPTYHLANVVDDRLMRITHVIRGDVRTSQRLRRNDC